MTQTFLQQVGSISLNLSLAGYLVFLLPQVWHNALNQSRIHTLSVGLHLILFFSYVCDLFYGFGLNMPWQYRLVTIIGLVMLGVQHAQIWHYRKDELPFHKYFRLYTLGFVIMTGCMLLIFCQGWLSSDLLSAIGLVSQIGWFTAALPQIRKNYRLKSSSGLSLYFVLLGIFLGLCDTVSAWSLDWKLPNKLGAPFLIIIKLVLLWQFVCYRPKR